MYIGMYEKGTYVHYAKSKLGLVKIVGTFSKHKFLAFFNDCGKQERLRMFWAKYAHNHVCDSYNHDCNKIGRKLYTLH